MEARTLRGAKRMTRKEFFEESDRLMYETRAFLDDARRRREESRPLVQDTEQLRASLRKRLLCGKESVSG
jgi:hypothetical protein